MMSWRTVSILEVAAPHCGSMTLCCVLQLMILSFSHFFSFFSFLSLVLFTYFYLYFSLYALD